MKKCEYRCNRCLIIEERWYLRFEEPLNSIPCHKCDGLADRLPWQKRKAHIFEDYKKEQDNFG